MLNLLLFTKDGSVKETIEEILSGQGFSLLTAETCQAAVTLIENTVISLMVVDFNLSRIESRTLLERTWGQYPDIRAITLSPAPLEQTELSGNRFTSYIGTSFATDAFKGAIGSEIQNLTQGGTMANVSPPLFVQLLEMEERSCILRIFEKKTKNRGLLVFRSGRLIDARFNTLRAMDAACRILAWEDADLFIENMEYPGKENIHADLQAVIMRSVHLKDEGRESSQPPCPAQDKELSFPETLKKHLQNKMGNRPGLKNIFPDPAMKGLINDCQAMGEFFDLGPLKLGYTDDGADAKIFVPGSTPTTLTLDAQCPRDKMTQLIKKFLDQL